ncbi:MAG: hypothetical protein GX631_10025, partial [Dehalococcoidales bacterium]|nr:hypothetical protein [Dehalococcoidales bacterium]
MKPPPSLRALPSDVSQRNVGKTNPYEIKNTHRASNRSMGVSLQHLILISTLTVDAETTITNSGTLLDALVNADNVKIYGTEPVTVELGKLVTIQPKDENGVIVNGQNDSSPIFEDSYPKLENLGPNSFDIVVRASDNLNSVKYYAVAFRAGALFTEPSADQVIAGTDGTDSHEVVVASSSYTAANIDARLLFSGFSSLIGYNVYVVAQDISGNKSEVKSLTVTTLSEATPPVIKEGYPVTADIGPTSFDIVVQADEVGNIVKFYAVAYVKSDATLFPTADQIVASTDGANSGCWTYSNIDTTLSFSNLHSSTLYDVFVVAVDTSGNKSEVKLLVVPTAAVPFPVPATLFVPGYP